MTAIFTKKPEPGKVKTRLSPPLTPEQGAALAAAMLEDTVARQLACGAFRTAVVFAPEDAGDWFRRRFPALGGLEAQRGAGLGQRLAHFFASALARPDNRSVVVLGSDAPWVGSDRVEEAHRALEGGHDLVLGPDRGGGYYLVGLSRSVPELFTAIEMSTGSMFEETLALARSHRLSTALLAETYDVDREADLRRLSADLDRTDSSHPDHPRATAEEMKRLFPNGLQ